MTLQEIIDEFTSPLNKGTEEEKLKKIRSQVEELPFEAEPLDSEVIRLEQQIKELATSTHKTSMEIRHICEYGEDVNAKGKADAINRIKVKVTDLENIAGVIAHPDKYPPLTELNKH